MGTPIYEFPPALRSHPPRDWCVPGSVSAIQAWENAYGQYRKEGNLIMISACAESPNCGKTPAQIRDQGDAFLSAHGLRPANAPPTPLDVYSIARNIRSEFGAGTPMEKLALAWAAINRATREGSASVTANLIGSKGNYGKQVGRQRPASTAQDPSVADYLIAFQVYSDWKTTGFVNDPTHGAEVYFDRVSQDAQHAKDPENNPSSTDVYNSWAEGGDWLMWAGHVPDVRPFRLLLFKHYPELRAARANAERARINKLGLAALRGVNKAPRATFCTYTLGRPLS